MKTSLTLLLLCAIASPLYAFPTPAGIADNLKAGADEEVYLVVAATGVQIYECLPKKDAIAQLEWTFKSPEALLYGASRELLGKHYAGPTWEASDGSKVKGVLKARQDAPAGNIPWLLLTATSEGAGRLANVTSVQRVNTVGGVAPKDGCDAANAGKVARVNYSADYYFYRRK
jgi:Protein of unknown function (DUF3455)